jgi:hypothetical protein
MLEGVGIHHQAVLAEVPVVAELTRQDLVEQPLALCATAEYWRSALGAMLNRFSYFR